MYFGYFRQIYVPQTARTYLSSDPILAIFYPFSQFREINISLLSLQTQPNTAPNLFHRGVEYGKYESVKHHITFAAAPLVLTPRVRNQFVIISRLVLLLSSFVLYH